MLEHKRLDEDTARKYFVQILTGVLVCHKASTAHRDLKLENLLLDESGERILITDFGFAKGLSSSGGGSVAKTVLGTAVYVAPEVLAVDQTAAKSYDGKKADLWSCGVTLFVMITGKYPFKVR